jgi:AraC family transcriptional regulator
LTDFRNLGTILGNRDPPFLDRIQYEALSIFERDDRMNCDFFLQVQHHRYYKKSGFSINPFASRYWTLYAVEKGSFNYVISKEMGSVSEGDMIICPPNIMFDRVAIESLRFHIFFFDLVVSNNKSVSLTSVMRVLPSYRLSLHDRDRFYSNMHFLRMLHHSRHPVNLNIIGHYINDLWILSQMQAANLNPSDEHTEDMLMHKIKLILDQQACTKVSLSELALSNELSTSQLTRRFKSSYGITPVAYVTYVRLQKAKSYLESTKFTLEHIADLCGYDNPYYFSKVFTNHYKLPPSQYRKLFYT